MERVKSAQNVYQVCPVPKWGPKWRLMDDQGLCPELPVEVTINPQVAGPYREIAELTAQLKRAEKVGDVAWGLYYQEWDARTKSQGNLSQTRPMSLRDRSQR